jgi:hypothetical protein
MKTFLSMIPASALAVALLASAAPAAQREATGDQSMRGDKRYSDRDRMSNWDQGKKQLEQALKTGLDKNAYRQQLEKLGYKITAVNYDDPDYVEYEVVKGNQSYEVQIDFNKDTRRASKVEIETNMWKAEATERALQTAEGGRAGQERGAAVGRTTESGRMGEQRASSEVRSGSHSSGMEGQARTSERAGSIRAEGHVTMASAEEVRQLQQALKEKGHDPGPIDGVMGPQTQQALRQFQQANGIQATGTLNAETKERLGLEAKAKTWQNTQVEGNRESGGGAGAAPGLP